MDYKNKSIEIPFGAKDSELYRWEYTIPEGMVAEIKDDKVIVKKAESEDEKIRKQLIRVISEYKPKLFTDKRMKEVLAWLEKQKKQSHWKPSEEQMAVLSGIKHLVVTKDTHAYSVLTSLEKELEKL